MFNSIGTEFLYSDANSPQVLVTIDGLEAFCPALNCDYKYVAASTAKITGQAYDTATKVLTVTGTNLLMTGLDVTFGGITCASSPAATFSVI